MQVNNEEKRLYYLRRYNRLYKDQIYLLEQQIKKLSQTKIDLEQDNERLKKDIHSIKTYAIKEEDDSNMLQKEIHMIKKYLVEIYDNQKVLIYPNNIRVNLLPKHLIGALHRPYNQSTYLNGLGKEIVVEMKEDNDKKSALDQSTNINDKNPEEIKKVIELHSEEEAKTQGEKDTNNLSLEALRQQVTILQEQLSIFEENEKDREKLNEHVSHLDNQEEKIRTRVSNVTFRDIQQANQIYSTSKRSMNRQTNHNVQSHNRKQEDHIQKRSKNHKKPEIIQQPLVEISDQSKESPHANFSLKEKENPTKNQTNNKQREIEEQRNGRESIDGNVSSIEMREQMNEQSNTSSIHKVSETNRPDEMNQHTIQPHMREKGEFGEEKYQPSFLKSLFNKLK